MKIHYTALLIIAFASCNKSVDIPGFNEDAWKHDRLGCEGIRYQMSNNLNNIKEQLKGLDLDEIESVLGKPDKIELGRRNQKYFIYAISPSQSCKLSADTIENKELSIRFNAIGLAYEVIIL